MRFAPLSEFIVPLIFVAIWAVTWLLNRESQPLAPRPRLREPEERGGGDFSNTGPGSGGLGSPALGPDAPRFASSPPLRPAQAGRPVPRAFERSLGPEMTLGPGDSILFSEPRLESPPRGLERPPAPRAPRPPQNRRSGRGKGGAKQARQWVNQETSQPRELTQQVSSSMAQLKGKPLVLTPLNLPLTPLQSLPLPQTGVSFLPPSTSVPKIVPIVTAPLNVAETLANPARLREIFIWNELLQPPVALRRNTRLR